MSNSISEAIGQSIVLTVQRRNDPNWEETEKTARSVMQDMYSPTVDKLRTSRTHLRAEKRELAKELDQLRQKPADNKSQIADVTEQIEEINSDLAAIKQQINFYNSTK